MAKATHFGNCQCCGAFQKLPAGLLSIHGYTVEDGWFSGVCRGTSHLPFQQSHALIDQFIASAEAKIVELNAQIAKLLAPATEPVGWEHTRTTHRSGKVTDAWKQVNIIEHNGTIGWMTEDRNGRERFNPAYCHSMYGTALEVATKMNSYRAEAFRRIVTKTETYIEWQQTRVANWTEQPLVPIMNALAERERTL